MRCIPDTRNQSHQVQEPVLDQVYQVILNAHGYLKYTVLDHNFSQRSVAGMGSAEVKLLINWLTVLSQSWV